MRKKALIFRIFCLCVAICSTLVSFCFVADAAASPQSSGDSSGASLVNTTYDQFLQSHLKHLTDVSSKTAVANPVLDIVSPAYHAEYEGRQGVVELDSSFPQSSWTVSVEQEGLYNISLDYYQVIEKGQNITIAIKVNGDYPYEEASRIIFSQIWQDDLDHSKPFATDMNGNDLMPNQIQVSKWVSHCLSDSEGYYDEPLLFYFGKGVSTISVIALEGALAVAQLRLQTAEMLPTYRQYRDEAPKSDAVSSGFFRKIQAERPAAKSDPFLYASFDKSNPLTEPSDPYKIKRNIIGSNWNLPKQYLEWEIEVPADGYYKLGFKYRQNTKRRMVSLRKLYIDGTVPFSEAKSLRFPYGTDFQMMIPGNDMEEYLFYLTAGERHTIRLEVTLGELAGVVQDLQDTLYKLGEIRRKIIMITSVNPDMYRDYELEKEYPNMSADMKEVMDALSDIVSRLKAISQDTKVSTRAIDDLIYQLNKFINKPYSITADLTSFGNNISSTSSFLNTLKEQPLELDYLTVSAPNTALPKVKASFWQRVVHEARQFFGSFLIDYSQSGTDSSDSIKVWIQSGREQLYILRNLIDTYYQDKSVELKLVRSTILQSIMSGIEPDIVLGLARSEPVNLGLRGALEDLGNYGDFSELKKQFIPDAFEPYRLEGKTFALPETQLFNMMFCRTDILQELGLSVPQTWQQFLDAASIIQRNNMEVGLPNAEDGTGLFPTLLYQNGGSFYNEEKTKTAFDTKMSFEAFAKWVDYYTKYSFPLFKDDYNRFRSGEMPIAIMTYSFYNQLSVAAPEIKNYWKMEMIPGTLRSDGTIDRTECATGTAAVMLKSSKNKEKSWEFLKWWVSSHAQSEFGKRLEYVMGSAARYTPANLEAFKLLPWTKEEISIIERQWQWVREIPEVPGGYYVTRNLNNAFRASAIRLQNPRESLNYWSKETDKEIARKRKDYNLP